MTKREELEIAAQVVKNAQMRVDGIEYHLSLLEQQISFLLHLELKLIENIEILKKQNIVPLAQEYKRSKFDLGQTRERMLNLRNDKQKYLKVLKNSLSDLRKSKESYDIIESRHENNVVFGIFRRK